jgi:hypothetical protein
VSAAGLPAPLVAADVDLRGLQYMPLFGERLFGSETWIAAGPDARVAALRLWWRAYAHEVPAASLPDDDRLLSDYAGYGAAVKAWRKVRAASLRGFVKCSDGRLYHSVLADIALESWDSRRRNREKNVRWRARNRAVTAAVTAAETVTRPSRDAGEGQGGEREGRGEAAEAASAPAAPASAPASVHALPLPNPDVDAAFAAWQAVAAREGWPPVMFLNPTRRWKLGQRLAEIGGLDGWNEALAAAADAAFLRAPGPDSRVHAWFDFDWMLDPQKLTRLMEGRYAERRHDDTRSNDPRSSAAAAGIDAAFARRSLRDGR